MQEVKKEPSDARKRVIKKQAEARKKDGLGAHFRFLNVEEKQVVLDLIDSLTGSDRTNVFMFGLNNLVDLQKNCTKEEFQKKYDAFAAKRRDSKKVQNK